jgi:hypothetical protein
MGVASFLNRLWMLSGFPSIQFFLHRGEATEQKPILKRLLQRSWAA